MAFLYAIITDMPKYFPLKVDVVNGEVKVFPETFYFKCDEVVPVGNAIIRYFTDDMCQVARRTFYIRRGENLFGTSQFNTEKQFWDYTDCYPSVTFAYMNGCYLKLNGRNALIT